ncbi:MAG: endolytic transglycosylase MltG, partial [Bdellovibrionales bacterium]|nr:endolytic transglycosylase MltG [Bdellovibrionales bacterium]
MSRYKTHDRRTRFAMPNRLWIVLGIVIAVALIRVILARSLYYRGLEPVSSSQETTIYTVEQGATVKEIAQGLEEKKLIRSAWSMELYIHSKQLSEKMLAGTYALSPSEGTPSIVRTMTRGEVATRLVTILPGKRIDQVRAGLINDGFDPDSVDAALDPAQYSDLPVMAIKPKNVNTLEGLLWPESFQRDSSTTASTIIRQSLAEMGEQLTTDVQASFARQGLTTYQGVTLASILIQEVDKPNDQAQAAQVFLKRLKSGVTLGSDVTARYGAIAAGRAPSLTYDSPYNTLIHKGLPPTPISTISKSSLEA